MKTEQKLAFTGERFVPWLQHPHISYEHLHRYAYAADLAKGKSVLDLASGEGYGAALLAQEASSVVGIDIDSQTIEHAKQAHNKPNLRFIEGSITDVPVQEEQFDVITCFEAIEHIEDQDGLLKEVGRLLKSDGVFFVSTPNKKRYSDKENYHNDYHVKELYLEEFEALLEKYFTHWHLYGQRVYSGSYLWPIRDQAQRDQSYTVARTPRGFVYKKYSDRDPQYFIALASNRDLQNTISSSLLDESDAIDADYSMQIQDLKRELGEARVDLEQTKKRYEQTQASLKEVVEKTRQHEKHMLSDIKQLQAELRAHQRVLQSIKESRLFRASQWLRNLLGSRK